MASRKFFHSKPNYIYPAAISSSDVDDDNHFEFDEADLWNDQSTVVINNQDQIKKQIPNSRSLKSLNRKSTDRVGSTSSSLPVNIPDWSKILKKEDHHVRNMGDDQGFDQDEDGDDEDDDENKINGGDYRNSWVPPHEYLANRRGASFSVHEGIGRTLKGSDLRRVRNAIWKKVGFED